MRKDHWQSAKKGRTAKSAKAGAGWSWRRNMNARNHARDRPEPERAGSGTSGECLKAQRADPGVPGDRLKVERADPGVLKDRTKTGRADPGVLKDRTKMGRADPGVLKDRTKMGRADPGALKDRTKTERADPSVLKDRTKTERADLSVARDCLRADRPGQRRGRRKNRRSAGRKDYSVYVFSPMELVGSLAVYMLLDGCVSFLFFRSLRAFIILLPGAALFFREQRKNLCQKRKKELTGQFLDGIQLMLAALQAGYSAENALREACAELEKIYSPDAAIVLEFHQMDVQMRMSYNLEDLLLDFGRRSDIPDILSFAEVFLTAKRTGGDLIVIIRNTISCIRQKQETMQEIETTLAGKVMEQNIMSAIPILILVYVDLSSPGFLDVMYETTTGVAVMVLCFGVYLLAFFWGQSIVRIEV